jgi:hypothetical protein
LATLVAFFQFSPISCNHGYQLSRISQVIVSTIGITVHSFLAKLFFLRFAAAFTS